MKRLSIKAEVLRDGWSAPRERKSRLAARLFDHSRLRCSRSDFAIFVRMQPPTVIRIGPNGDASVAGQACEGRCHRPCDRGH